MPSVRAGRTAPQEPSSGLDALANESSSTSEDRLKDLVVAETLKRRGVAEAHGGKLTSNQQASSTLDIFVQHLADTAECLYDFLSANSPNVGQAINAIGSTLQIMGSEGALNSKAVVKAGSLVSPLGAAGDALKELTRYTQHKNFPGLDHLKNPQQPGDRKPNPWVIGGGTLSVALGIIGAVKDGPIAYVGAVGSALAAVTALAATKAPTYYPPTRDDLEWMAGISTSPDSQRLDTPGAVQKPIANPRSFLPFALQDVSKAIVQPTQSSSAQKYTPRDAQASVMHRKLQA
ncbi:hypothetical protein [Streptomyces sp. NPDC097610]|uniref:hypothetical protein n=1 Tax=Streptomyces sp. NPDC097610 TaxID=3157227 RepID=UPI0033228544